MDEKSAEQARDHVFEAIKHLIKSLSSIRDGFPEAAYDQMRRTVGLTISRLETDYLAHIFAMYPDLDDLARLKRQQAGA